MKYNLAMLLADTFIFHVVALSIFLAIKTSTHIDSRHKSIILVSIWVKLTDWKWAKVYEMNLSTSKSTAQNLPKQKDELRYMRKLPSFLRFSGFWFATIFLRIIYTLELCVDVFPDLRSEGGKMGRTILLVISFQQKFWNKLACSKKRWKKSMGFHLLLPKSVFLKN